MGRIAITDHALMRFLERAAGMDLEALRHHLAQSLDRAHDAARSVCAADYVIKADGLLFLVRGDRVITVIEDEAANTAAKVMARHTGEAG